MKRIPSKIGLRLRALRQSRRQTQESLAAECRQRGFAITREKLAKYEICVTHVPARFIPIMAHILKVEITDLLPPIGGEAMLKVKGVKTSKPGTTVRLPRSRR
jgi:transcriptional regulator with XRE-family HTH domain